MAMASAKAPMMWSSSFPLVPSFSSMEDRSSPLSRSTWLTNNDPVAANSKKKN